jgi:hypothetical protein
MYKGKTHANSQGERLSEKRGSATSKKAPGNVKKTADAIKTQPPPAGRRICFSHTATHPCHCCCQPLLLTEIVR